MSDDRDIRERLGALEHKVDHIYRHLIEGGEGPAVIPPLAESGAGVSEAVAELVRSGDTIAAIKQHRTETGCDLVTAQKAIADLG